MQYIHSPFKKKSITSQKFDIFGFGRFLSDRKNPNNAKKWPYEFTIRDDCFIPSEGTKLSFEQIWQKRLDELKNMNKDDWVVLWSGGIDSSLIIRLLLEREKDFSFSVMLSDASIQTFPEMYKELLKRRIKLIPITKYFEIVDSVSYMTGAAADPLTFQYANWMGKVKPNISVDEFYSVYSWILKSKPLARFQIELLLKSCPYKLEYFCDLAWWYSFNFSWQGTYIGHNINFQKANTQYEQKLEPFFSGELFQKWSLSTYQDRRIEDLRDIKAPIKNYMYELGDKDYVKRITKTRSHVLAIGMNNNFKGRDVDANSNIV